MCANCCSIFRKHWMSYLRIIFAGIVSVTAISGIYSYLLHVKEIKIAPDTIHGIECGIPNPLIGLMRSLETDHCNEVAQQMHNLSSSNEDYQCSLTIQYSHSSSRAIYSDFWEFQAGLIILVFCTIQYGIFAIIHDCSLIYHVSEGKLSQLKFHPYHKDFYILLKYLQFLHKFKNNVFNYIRQHCNCLNKAMLFILLYPFIIILWCLQGICAVIDLHFSLWIYAFFGCWDESLFHRLSYMSSSWIGITRGIIISSAGYMTGKGFTGFGKLLPSLDDKCICQCVYVFVESDFFGFCGVTLVLMILNALFAWTWLDEIRHGKHFLYLIKYSLSIETAYQLDPNDPAGYMVDKEFTNMAPSSFQMNTYYKVNDDVDDETENLIMQTNGTAESEIINSVEIVIEKDGSSRVFRLIIVFYALNYCGVFISFGLLELPRSNPYNYDQWFCVLLNVVFVIIMVLLGSVYMYGFYKVILRHLLSFLLSA